jgi:hypothetical protein
MHSNFIILSFPRFAGGKFISNCLSLSKKCCPQDPQCAEYLLSNPDDYQFRFDSVMKTLPPTRKEMINWISTYEFGDVQLYGKTRFNNWLSGTATPPDTLVNRLIDSNFNLFITAHGGDVTIQNLLKAWPDATILKLINHTKFSNISKNLKSNDSISIEEHAGNYCKKKYLELAGTSWPSWEEFEMAGYDIQKLDGYNTVQDEILSFYNWKNIHNKTVLFDVDTAIFNQTNFLSAMCNLYEQLELPDFNSKLIGKFWQSYMLLHIDNNDLT